MRKNNDASAALAGCGCIFLANVVFYAVAIVAIIWLVSFALKHNPF